MNPSDTVLVRLTIVSSELEAGVIRGLLETEGIASVARPTDVGAGAFDGWSPGGSREILVRERDLYAARELISRQ